MKDKIPATMKGAYLPGNSTVVMKDIPVPEPGHGEVLIKTKSSTICGSDIRAIYHEHLGKGPEGYNNKVAGHEPSGQIVKCGPGMRRFKEGDRVVIYHISGCGVCNDCRRGFMISCTSPHRAAYGWQRDGGMAPYIVAEEKDLVLLPDSLSYTDGAQIACGFGTCYEALEKIGICGNDAVLVVGLGPVGLAPLCWQRLWVHRCLLVLILLRKDANWPWRKTWQITYSFQAKVLLKMSWHSPSMVRALKGLLIARVTPAEGSLLFVPPANGENGHGGRGRHGRIQPESGYYS
jgi:hypothetical protein